MWVSIASDAECAAALQQAIHDYGVVNTDVLRLLVPDRLPLSFQRYAWPFTSYRGCNFDTFHQSSSHIGSPTATTPEPCDLLQAAGLGGTESDVCSLRLQYNTECWKMGL